MTKTVGLLHANEELATRIIEMCERHVPDWNAEYITSDWNTLNHLEAIDKIAQLRHGYDVIQVDTLVGPGPIAQIASWLSGTPVVGYLRGWGDYTNYHGQYAWKKRTRIRWKTRVQLRTMDGMASISHALVAGMSNMYPMGNTEVIERPYNVSKYSNGGSVSDDGDDTLTVTTVTNLRYAEKRDGVLTSLEGMKPILNGYRDVEYRIYGGGRHYETVADAVAEVDNAYAPGFVEGIPSVLAESDIFVYVSFLDGAPSTVYEAQSAGLPVIGGDAAGVPEAVGDAGLICPPTPKGVEKCVRELIENEDLRADLEKQSTAKMQTHNERVASDWRDYWESVL